MKTNRPFWTLPALAGFVIQVSCCLAINLTSGLPSTRAEDAECRDLAISKVVARNIVTLTERYPSTSIPAVVFVQNLGRAAELIPDAAALQALVELRVGALEEPVTLTAILVPPKRWPLIIAPHKKLAVVFTVPFDASVGSPGQPGPVHLEFLYVARLHPETLFGRADANAGNDEWPVAGAFPTTTTLNNFARPEDAVGPASRGAGLQVSSSSAQALTLVPAAAGTCNFKSISASPPAAFLKPGAALSTPITFKAVFTGAGCTTSWGPGDAAKFSDEGHPTFTCQWDKPGDHTVSCYLFPPGGGTAPFKKLTIQVLQMTFQNVDGARIGVSTPSADRSKTFHAIVDPPSAASNVQIRLAPGTENLALVGPLPPNNGDIEFSLHGVGSHGSATKNDCTVQAVLGNNVIAQASVTVVVPKKILSQDASGRRDYNYLAFEGDGNGHPGSSPAFAPGPGQAHVIHPLSRLSTFHGFDVTVHVGDQFGEAVGDIYAGAQVFELFPGAAASINRTVQADSTYLDPVGVPGADWNPNRAPVNVNSPAATAFLNKPPLFAPSPRLFPPTSSTSISLESQFNVHVDYFALTPAIRRTLTFFHDGTIKLDQTP